MPWIFKIDEGNVHSLTYDVMLHFGTLLALLAVYARRLVNVFRDDFHLAAGGAWRRALIPKLVAGTMPAAVVGVLFKDIIENQLRAPYITIFTLIAVSLLMLLAERVHRAGSDGGVTYGLAFIIGAAQAIALAPGVSRSGITITAAMLLGLKRQDAVDFSFLLSIPIVLGVSLYEGRHIVLGSQQVSIYLVGLISSFVFGVVSLRFLIGYLRRHSLDVFAYYRLALAVLIALLLI